MPADDPPAIVPASLLRASGKRRVWLWVGITFLITLLVGCLIVSEHERNEVRQARWEADNVATHFGNNIRERLEHSLSATYALAAVVAQGNGEVDNFEALAHQMLELYGGISNLQLAPGGVVSRIVPLEGNEPAIGHDLLDDSERNKEAREAIETRQLTLAGPFELIQGGVAVIGRLPVFLPDSESKSRFWGFTTALIHIEDLLESAQLEGLARQGYRYQLWRVHPDTGERQVIAHSGGEPLSAPVITDFEVPNGEWHLSVEPMAGWLSTHSITLESAAILLVAGVLSLLVHTLLMQPLRLRREVRGRTADLADANRRLNREIDERRQSEEVLRRSEERLRKISDASGTYLWEVNRELIYSYISGHCQSAKGYAPEELIGHSPLEFMPKEDIQPVTDTVRRAISRRSPFILEHRNVTKSGEIRWEEVRGDIFVDESSTILGLRGTGMNITQRKHTEEKLRLAANVFTHAREGIVITDPHGTILEVNEAFTRITGYSREEAIGQNPRILKSGRQSTEYYRRMWQAILEEGHWSGEVWNRTRDGEVYAEILTISAVHDETGQTVNYVALFTDITPLKEHQRELEHIAHYDALTNLPNRVLLADRLRLGMRQSQRRGLSLGVIYLDLDGFKEVNDTHGHDIGDDLLVAVSQRMKEALREGDTLARVGGDEFVAVLADLEQPEDCKPVLERLLEAAASPIKLADRELQVSASIGVTLYPDDNADADQLLRHADQAMYQAKQAGRNRYQLFDVAGDEAVQNRHESLERLRRGLRDGECVLHYQPKVNMESGDIIGVEALIRWQHPELGLLPPARFLPVIGDHPLCKELGEWVIDTALSQLDVWRRQGLSLSVSVNIDAYQLQQPDFTQRLATLLQAHPEVLPGNLVLEILETNALEEVVRVSEVIEACHLMGVHFAMDDFGTGYSSLTYLKRLPADMIKIDQSFIHDMLEDPDDLAIVKGVISLAHSFQRQVIAEGVESVAHAQMLLSLGCPLAQGYAIGGPMPAGEFSSWLEQWRTNTRWGAASLHQQQPS